MAAVSLPGEQRAFSVDLLLGAGKNTPSDSFGPVSVNLVTGNVSTSVSTPEMSTVGGEISVGFSYNSQTPLAGGLDAKYYADANSDRSYSGDPVVLARRDTSVFFDWGTGSPGYSVPSDNFIVRWDGYVTVPAAGSYTFGAISDDGARIWVGDTAAATPNVLDDWTNHGVPSSPLYSTTPVSFAAGSLTKKIRIEYYDAGASAVMKLYAKQGANPGVAVPASWLSASPAVLPHGWSMAASTISGFASARITNDAVTLFTVDGASWEYKKTAGGGFVPPAGVKDVVTQGPDGALTVIGEDGVTTSFSSDGVLTSATTGGDDRNPSSPKYTYAGDPLRLDRITDPVSGQFVNLVYQGDSDGCGGAAPSGLSAAPDGMLCRVVHFDGTDTKLWYAGTGSTLLGRVENPGGELYDYGYDGSGRLNKVRDPLAADAFASGTRTDAAIVTDIAYGGSPPWATNWATSVTLPAPNTAGDPRPQHTYGYQYNPNTDPATGFPITTVYDTALPAWNSGTQAYSGTAPYLRQVAFDGRLRLTSDTDATGKTTTTGYDGEDRVTSTVDPAGMKSTSVYDYAGRVTSSYGPGAASLFSGDTSSSTSVPRIDFAYDTRASNGEQQLAGTWWDGADFNNGASPPDPRPATITTMGTAEDWGTFQPVPGADFPDFSVRITGWVRLDATGDYRFYLTTGTAGRMWIDGQLVADTAPATGGSWVDPASTVTTPDGALFANAAAGSWHQIRADLRNTNAAGSYALQWKTPGSGTLADIPPGNVAPGYGNQTTSTEYDTAGGGDRTTSTNYGQLGGAGQFAGPQHGLPTAVTDAAGNSTQTSYERADQGVWMRRLTRTLPAGNGYTYTYWVDGEPSSQCPSAASNQAGRLKRATNPDPDGAGGQAAITYDTVYTARGQIAGTKNSGNPTWSCVTYDPRGRPLTTTYPNFTRYNTNGSTTPDVGARTVTYTYSGLATSVSDGTAGTFPIVTKVDLLGRVAEYTDAWNRKTTFTYDRWGRVTATAAPGVDTLYRYYDAAGRVELVRIGGTAASDEVADPNYDSAGRLLEVFYRSSSGKKGNSTKGAFTYDANNGELKKTDWNATVPVNPTPLTSNEVRYSRSGLIVDEAIDGTDPYRTGTTNLTLDNFTYDQAERLIDARNPGQQTTYTFNGTGGCGLLATAGKNTNRTTKVTNGGAPVTYCYDNADRLTSTTGEAAVGAIAYDARGNTTAIFDETHGYDSADRHYYTRDNPVGTAIRYTHDAEDRIIQREIISSSFTVTGTTRYSYPGDPDIPSVTLDNAGTVIESLYNLPGGVLLSRRPSTGNHVWSYPNIHGDITATATQAGAKTGATANYDPYGVLITGAHPDNLNSSLDYGWLGQHQRPTELRSELQPTIEMGARQYSPLLGRFLEVDPVEGGLDNDYTYVENPITQLDLSGEAGQGSYGYCMQKGSKGYSSQKCKNVRAQQASLKSYNKKNNKCTARGHKPSKCVKKKQKPIFCTAWWGVGTAGLSFWASTGRLGSAAARTGGNPYVLAGLFGATLVCLGY